MPRPKPSVTEKRFLASLTPEERRMVRDEDAGRELGKKLVVVTPERKAGQPPPTEAEIQAARDEVFDLFVQPQINSAIKIVLARHALPGEFEAVVSSRCLLCDLSVIAGTKARRAGSGQLMHSACVEEGLARGVEVEKRAAFTEKYKALQAIRAKERAE